ncbi:MAG: hypothetical protein ACKVOE_03220 [Rickettsiales bacterium]
MQANTQDMNNAMDSQPSPPLRDEDIAALSNYDAAALQLPLFMDAVLVVRILGRIDLPDFRIEHTFEPLNHMHAWVSYRREGALLYVGERAMRLNPQQLEMLNALHAVTQAGENVATRLRAWPRFNAALNVVRHHHVVVAGSIPHLRIQMVEQLPPGTFTRHERLLQPVAARPKNEWSMAPGRRYFCMPEN